MCNTMIEVAISNHFGHYFILKYDTLIKLIFLAINFEYYMCTHHTHTHNQTVDNHTLKLIIHK